MTDQPTSSTPVPHPIAPAIDYGSLVRDSLRFAWRYKLLWLFGLFTGPSTSSCSSPPTGPLGSSSSDPSSPAPDFPDLSGVSPETLAQLGAGFKWLEQNVWLVFFAVATVLAVVIFFFLIVQLLCRGALVAAAARLEAGEPVTLGVAWRDSRRVFWPFMWLMCVLSVAWAVVAIAILSPLAVYAVLLGTAAPSGRNVAFFVLGAFGLIVGAIVLVPFFIVANIVISYSYRALVVDGYGPIACLGQAWRVFRRNLGRSLITWLIGFALGIGASFIQLVALLIVLVPAFIAGIASYAVSGFSALTIFVAVGGLLGVILVGWAVSAPVNNYFWAYWTLAYLRLTRF
ncbi:MAG: hypothetical protein HY329_04750 [Chloroflexi bacterium]|nr:hypothetical protein [Chloroflexota bacterium]